MYRITRNQFPSYIKEKLSFCLSQRLQNLKPARSRTTFYRNSTFASGPIVWNSLPLSIKNATSTNQFMILCKQYFDNDNNIPS